LYAQNQKASIFFVHTLDTAATPELRDCAVPPAPTFAPMNHGADILVNTPVFAQEIPPTDF